MYDKKGDREKDKRKCREKGVKIRAKATGRKKKRNSNEMFGRNEKYVEERKDNI